GVEDRAQRHLREVVTLGDHLGADENGAGGLVEAGEDAGVGAALGRPVLRLDADVPQPGRVLRSFERADRAILVGTQVVAKGHDFPDVDLGVVVDADATLRFPDFRAEERTFAMVAQLAGRSGRGEAGGEVIVQTLAPNASSIEHAARHDSAGFLEVELGRRRALHYPPFSHLTRINFAAEEEARLDEVAVAVADELRRSLPQGSELLGPAPMFRVRNRHRRRILIKADDREGTVAAVREAVEGRAADRSLKDVALGVDVDPQ
ncbi:MAG TPA: helicase-related protein, partial [Solirubrobacterales bacterium]|nr:helicase-related protein [Solirubrobacterales bacterium]